MGVQIYGEVIMYRATVAGEIVLENFEWKYS